MEALHYLNSPVPYTHIAIQANLSHVAGPSERRQSRPFLLGPLQGSCASLPIREKRETGPLGDTNTAVVCCDKQKEMLPYFSATKVYCFLYLHVMHRRLISLLCGFVLFLSFPCFLSVFALLFCFFLFFFPPLLAPDFNW